MNDLRTIASNTLHEIVNNNARTSHDRVKTTWIEDIDSGYFTRFRARISTNISALWLMSYDSWHKYHYVEWWSWIFFVGNHCSRQYTEILYTNMCITVAYKMYMLNGSNTAVAFLRLVDSRTIFYRDNGFHCQLFGAAMRTVVHRTVHVQWSDRFNFVSMSTTCIFVMDLFPKILTILLLAAWLLLIVIFLYY